MAISRVKTTIDPTVAPATTPASLLSSSLGVPVLPKVYIHNWKTVNVYVATAITALLAIICCYSYISLTYLNNLVRAVYVIC